MGMATTPLTALLPFAEPILKPGTSWFSCRGCVQVRDGRSQVIVGGTLVGEFGPEERGLRNVLLLGLSFDPKMHLGLLADAFGISSEALRQMRRLYEVEGIAAVWLRTPGRPKGSKVTVSLRKRLERLFEKGASISTAHEKLAGPRGGRVSRSTVARVRTDWLGRTSGEAPAPRSTVPATLPLALVVSPVATEKAAKAPEGGLGDGGQNASPALPASASPSMPGSAEEDKGAQVDIPAIEPLSAGWVQHLGTWLMVAMVARLGLHRNAETLREGRVGRVALRIAIDAAIVALSLGEKCVEGVRRAATASASALLLATQPPSATWVRRSLGRFSEDMGGPRLHLAMAGAYLREAEEEADGTPVAFYIDNHLRAYTGKHLLRKGWSMQAKRAKPGTTDYYVHDEDGRPVLRVPMSSNAPLTAVLTGIALLIRQALGPKQRILLVFDRAGAFPGQLAKLRDTKFDFVTYERRPYQKLASTAFHKKRVFRGEAVGVSESRANLGGGRGRVRRIALRLPDGRQLNLLAVSKQPSARLIEAMGWRWNQENGFRHGNQRWGINQLDGRTVEDYSPDAVIPNPARRRLDRALKLAKQREGEARRKLARLSKVDPERQEVECDLSEALAQQSQLEALRPSTPTHARLAETELAGELVEHTTEYKTTLDTLRIACANAESDLAGELGPYLRRPKEAKRALRNLLSAPGRVTIGKRSVTATLSPAGTRNEMSAFVAMLAVVNRRRLALPGDPQQRRLCFKTQ